MTTFEFATILITTLLTIAALYIATMQYVHEKRKQRIERFELDSKSIKNDYTKLSSQAIDLYRKIYATQIASSQIQVNNLVYKPSWASNPAYPLMPIDDLPISLIPKPEWPSREYQKTSEVTFRQRKINPYDKKSLVDNILIHLDHKHLWDSPTYIVNSIIEGSIPSLQVYKSSYFDFYNSCMCFGFELAHAINNPVDDEEKTINFRKTNDLFDLTNRYCAMGTVTLSVFTNVQSNEKVKSYFVLHSRSEDVAEGKNIINAVPAGTYQPSVSSDKLEPLSLNIIREFGEEIRGKKEFTYAYSIDEIESDLFAKEMKTNIYFLGIGFNPLNAYLEILTLAIIDLSKSGNATEFGPSLENVRQKLRSNFEGSLELQEFNRQKLSNISATYHAAPSLKEIAAILVKRLDARNTDAVEEILN